MRKTLETLIQLQEIDGQLRALEQSKGDLPQRIASISEEIDQLQAMVTEKAKQLEKSQSTRRETAAEVALLRERLKKYQEQLYQVKTNKEYDAISSELDNTMQAIDNYEFQLLELEENEQRLQGELEQLKPQLQQLQGLLAEHQHQLQVTEAQNADKEAQLLNSREEVVSKLSRQVLSMYERIRQGRGGIALAYLQDGACSQCSSRIPPQRGLEIRMMNSLYVCEVCGRILVYGEKRENPLQEVQIDVDQK